MSSSIPHPVPEGATDAQLRHIINYWRIEAECNHGRWIHAMEENERLRASSFTTCVPSEEYEKLLWKVSELRGRCTGLEQGLIEFGKYAPVDQLLIHNGTKWTWRYEKRNNNEPSKQTTN